MDDLNSDQFPFSVLNDLQLAAELHCSTKERLPFSSYENIKFDYSNNIDSFNLLSDIDPDLQNPVRSDVITSNYYHNDELHQLLIDNSFRNIFLFQNIRSMNENFEMFCETLAKLILPFVSVFGLCETRLTDGVERLFNLPGYSLFSNNYQSNAGGVAIFVKNELNASLLEDLCVSNYDIETIFVEIESLNNKKELYGVVYRRPDGNFESFISKFEAILNKINNPNCNIAGDFNLNLLNYEFNQNVQDYVDLMLCKGFLPCIDRPTRITNKSATLIDHCWCNNMNDVRLNGILMHNESDHFGIFTSRSNSHVRYDKDVEIRYRDFSISDPQQLLNHVNEMFADFSLQDDVNSSYALFNNKMQQIIENYFPLRVKKIKKRKLDSPWMNNEILTAIRDKNKIYKKYLKKPVTYGSEYRAIRNQLNNKIKFAKRRYYNNLLHDAAGNCKQMWKVLNQILQRKTNNANTINALTVDDNNVTSRNEIVNILNDYFVSIGEKLSQGIPDVNNSHLEFMGNACPNDLSFRPVSTAQVIKIIKELKVSSAGYDNIHINLLKSSCQVIGPIIMQIVNQSLTTSIFPDKLKVARLIPLFKSGDRKIVKNYRPISILPSVSKIVERIVYKQLFEHLTLNKILVDEQFGFRPNRSPQKAILKLLDYIINALDNNEACIGVFLDLSKAFDALDHNILLDKLRHYGVRNKELEWFKNYLYNRKQFVEIGVDKSDTKNIRYGVPQGSTLGPLLFLIFVNDLSNVSEKLFKILFADDTNFLLSDKDINNLCNTLNNELYAVNLWFKVNKLTKNMDKTHAVAFTKRNHNNGLNILLDDKVLPIEDETKFLGIKIDKKLSWKSHIQFTRNKISKVIGVISKVKQLLTRKALVDLYYSYIFPYLQYCNIAWGTANKTALQPLRVIQKRIIRIICRVAPFDHTNLLFKNLNILKLNDIHDHEMLKFIHSEVSNPTVFNFTNVGQIHNHNTRRQNDLRPPRYRSTLSKRFVKYNGCISWNNILLEIRNIVNKTTFKIKAKKHLTSMYE